MSDKQFIPFEFEEGPGICRFGFDKDETIQMVKYPEHCNLPTRILINPLTHKIDIQGYEINGERVMYLTLIPVDGDR